MENKFISSGIYQFLDEVAENKNIFYTYGKLIAKNELAFEEEIYQNKALLYNTIKKTNEKLPTAKKNSSEW